MRFNAVTPEEKNRILTMDAATLGRCFQTGKLSPVDLLQACLEQIRLLDGPLGICNEMANREQLLAAARQSRDRWLAGAPLSKLDGIVFGVKANIAIKGLAWHAGIAHYRARVAAADATVVATMRERGMLPVATLNMHEAALGVTSNNPAYRTTRNPRDPARIPGGSSGGSAAAVAAGCFPVALGTDDLGSVRLPAALCGVVGLKPERGELPLRGVIPLSPLLDHVGVIARNVADIAAVMALFTPEAKARRLPVKRWEVDCELEDSVSGACLPLPVSGNIDWRDVNLPRTRRAGLLVCELDAHRHFGADIRLDPAGFSDEFRAGLAWATGVSANKAREARAQLTAISRRLRQDLTQTIVISPTAPCVAPLRADKTPVNLADLTAPAAIAGVPAISIPVHRPGNLPVGLQICGPSTADILRSAADYFPGTAPTAVVGHQAGTDL